MVQIKLRLYKIVWMQRFNIMLPQYVRRKVFEIVCDDRIATTVYSRGNDMCVVWIVGKVDAGGEGLVTLD